MSSYASDNGDDAVVRNRQLTGDEQSAFTRKRKVGIAEPARAVSHTIVLRSDELDSAHLDRWRELCRRDAMYASPFFDPAFTQLVGAVRGDVYAAVMHSGDDIVGFFPFQRNSLGVGYPAGWGMCDYQGPVVRADVGWRVPDLMRSCGLRSFEFDHLPTRQQPFQPFGQTTTPSLLLDVSGGFERYEHTQRRAGRAKTFSRLRARWRRLEAERGPVRFESNVADPRALAQLLAWKSDQYRRTGMADLLERGWFREVIERAASAAGEGFAGLLSALYAGERPVALHLGLRSERVWHYWLPAHDVDASLARCSPGLLLIVAMANAAESLGVEVIDFGKGRARHKLEFANGEVALSEGLAGSSAVARALRLRRRARSVARRAGVGPLVRRMVKR